MDFQSLLRMASGFVQNILSQLTQQLNVVDDQAMNPIQQMVQQVTDGIWKGEGANAFVEELSNILIPSIAQIGQEIGTMGSNIQFARDTIEQADTEVDQQVKSNLFDAFSFY